MGERVVRPGIRTSDKTAKNIRKGGWVAQVFYDWLLTVVDDYGRTDARPSILRTELFPLLLDLVREADVSRCLQSCAASGLIRLYSHDGQPYLEVLNFRQRLRAKRSRFPAPSAGHCHDIVVTMPTETETETEDPPNPPPGGKHVGFDAFWAAYPRGKRKVGRPKCQAKWERERLEKQADVILAGLGKWKRSQHWADGFVVQPHRFLHERFWETDPGENDNSADGNGFARRKVTQEDIDVAEGIA